MTGDRTYSAFCNALTKGLLQGRWLQVRFATIDEHVPQLQKRDAATIAISEVIPLRLIDDDGGHLRKLEQPMQFDVIHLTSL
jgi:hypothetical protein